MRFSIGKILRRFACFFNDHRYVTLQEFGDNRKVGCTRCGQQWGMNNRVQISLKWDDDLKRLYEIIEEVKNASVKK